MCKGLLESLGEKYEKKILEIEHDHVKKMEESVVMEQNSIDEIKQTLKKAKSEFEFQK